MSEPIVSFARIKTKAWHAYANQQSIGTNPYPVDSAAYLAWRYEYQRLEREFGKATVSFSSPEIMTAISHA